MTRLNCYVAVSCPSLGTAPLVFDTGGFSFEGVIVFGWCSSGGLRTHFLRQRYETVKINAPTLLLSRTIGPNLEANKIFMLRLRTRSNGKHCIIIYNICISIFYLFSLFSSSLDSLSHLSIGPFEAPGNPVSGVTFLLFEWKRGHDADCRPDKAIKSSTNNIAVTNPKQLIRRTNC